MLNQVKVENVRTSITGEIQGVVVTIDYENLAGVLPVILNARASIMDVGVAAPTGMMNPVNGCFISVNRFANGTRTININGNKTLEEVQLLVADIEAELELIANPL